MAMKNRACDGFFFDRRRSCSVCLLAVSLARGRSRRSSACQHAAGDAPGSLGGSRTGKPTGAWDSADFKDKTFVGHGGHCPGYETRLMLQTREKIATIFMANASDLNTKMYSQRAYEIVAPAIAEALESPDAAKQPNPALSKYTGIYSNEPWGGETAVLIWKGELAMFRFPTDDPLDGLVKLKHVEGNRFRRIRDDDELGEEIVFEVGSDGKVARLKRHSNYLPKVR